MGLEVATYISQLLPANPVGGVDNYSTADDHLRLIKQVLQNQFPNLGAAAMNATAAQLNFMVGVTSAVQTQLDAKEALANKNANNGYAGLNGSAQLADARVAISNVTQHQASLAIAGTQITSGLIAVARLGSGTPTSSTLLDGSGAWRALAAGDITTGTFADARIAASNVTQHQAALTVNGSQLTGGVNASFLTSGTLADARVFQTNVTQHQAALALAGTQITSGTIAAARLPTTVLAMLFSDAFSLGSVTSPGSLGADQNNYAPGIANSNVLRLTASTPINITGLAGMANNQVLLLINIGASQINLVNESGSSTAANRFNFSGASRVLLQNQAVFLWYDGASSRVRVLES